MMKFLGKLNNPYFFSLILGIIVFLNIYPDYLLGGDVEAIFLYPEVFLQKSLYLWSESNSFGGFISSTGNIIVYSIFYFLLLLFSPYFLNIFLYILGYVGAYLSAVFLLKNFGKYYLQYKVNNFDFIPILSLFYVINLQFNQLFFRGIFTEIFTFSLIPLGISFFIHFLHGEKKYLIYTPLLLILWGNPAHLAVFFIVVGIFYIYHIYIKGFRKTNLYSVLILGALFITLSQFIFLPLYSFLKNGGGGLAEDILIKSQTIEAEFYQQNVYHSFLNLFQNLNQGYFSSGFNFLHINDIFSISLFFLLFFFIVGAIFIKKDKKSYVFFFFIFLITILILQGSKGILGEYYRYFVENIPAGAMFRSIHTKFNYVILVIELLLLFIIFNSFSKKRLFYSIFPLLLFPAYPFLFHLFDSQYLKVDIPKNYIKSIKEYSKSIENTNYTSAVVLPYTNLQWQSFTDWGFWGYSFFQQSNYNINFHTSATLGVNGVNRKYFKDISNINIVNLEYLKNHNIDTLIIQKDFNYKFTDYYIFTNQKKEINNFLEENKAALNLLYDSDYFSVYGIDYQKNPNFFAQKIEFTKQNPTNFNFTVNVFNEQNITKSGFDKNWKLYLEPYSEIDCKNPITYTNQKEKKTKIYTVQPGDDFQKIGEIYGIKAEKIIEQNPDWNQSGKGWLLIGQEIQIPLDVEIDPETSSEGQDGTLDGQQSLENYSVTECESENKFYNGGELSKLWEKPIFDDTHTMVYDYANQWTLDADYIKKNYPKEYYKENPDGSIDVKMTLYFKPQSYFYLGLIISGTTFLLLTLGLIVGSVRDRKKRKEEK